MSQPSAAGDNVSGEFPRLARAPIVEAVIHWQAKAEKPLEQAQLQQELTRRFPDYHCQTQHSLETELAGSAEGTELCQRTGWAGFRLDHRGEDQHHVVQIGPTGVVFSRLPHYDSWNTFEAESMRFWDAYVELAAPTVIQRLGVRFINQIRLTNGDRPSDFLHGIAGLPTGIELSAETLFYQDTLRVPGTPYRVNWIRTTQPTVSDERMLIVDIDVSVEPIATLDKVVVRNHLAEMRHTKNNLFFRCMTDTAMQRFGKV